MAFRWNAEQNKQKQNINVILLNAGVTTNLAPKNKILIKFNLLYDFNIRPLSLRLIFIEKSEPIFI